MNKEASVFGCGIIFALLLFFSSFEGAWAALTAGVSPAAGAYDEDVIVYTAHQDWLSRIYVLRMDGSVINYFEYAFYYFADLEVVKGEVYVAEAFAPRVYKVDISTGELETIIDDWSLFYFYDLAFDGTSFYLNEWDLNRYDIYGSKTGTASFDEAAFGGAWDGTYYWTLNDMNQVKCWDLSNWPAVDEIPGLTFNPPGTNCRGLWFDGEYFWTAENIDGELGWIYTFGYDGVVIDQWLEPAFNGWSACLITADNPPEEIVIDDADPEFLSIGGWSTTEHSDCYGTGVHYTRPGGGDKKAAWRVDQAVSVPGNYDVFTWKFDHELSGYMATDVHFRIYHRDGSSDWILVDQSTPGDEWVYLGTFEFDRSVMQGVVVTDGADGYVVADAVKLIWSSQDQSSQNQVITR